MLLVNFVLLYFALFLLAFSRNERKDSAILKLFWFLNMLSLSIFSRFDFPAYDILNYFKLIDSGFFKINEPMLYILFNFLFNLFHSAQLVFISTDIILILMLYNVFSKSGLPLYILFLLSSSFVFLIPFFNIYRQGFATLLFIYSLFLSANTSRVVFFFLSAAFHNVIIILFPFLFRFKGCSLLIYYMSYFLSLFALINLELISSSRSQTDTGADMALVLFLLSTLSSIFLIYHKRFFTGQWVVWSQVAYASIAVSIFGFFVLGGGLSERVSMLILFVLFFPLARVVESVDPFYKIFFRLTLILMYIVPFWISSLSSYLLRF